MTFTRTALALLVWLPALPAVAAGFNHLGTGPSSTEFFASPSATLLTDGELLVGTSLSYGHAPLTCREPTEEDSAHRTVPVVGLGVQGFDIAYAPTSFLELSASVPVGGVWADRQLGNIICPSFRRVEGLRMGLFDPTLRGRLALVPTSLTRLVRLNLEGRLSFPTMQLASRVAQGTAYQRYLPDEVTELFGDSFGSAAVLAVLGVNWRSLLVSASGGVSLRPRSPLLGAVLGSELLYGVAGRVHVLFPGLYVVGDVFGRYTTDTSAFAPVLSSSIVSIPIEALVGLRYRFGPVEIAAGTGGGILPGYGAPALRWTASITYRPSAPELSLRPSFDFLASLPWMLELLDKLLWSLRTGTPPPDERQARRRPAPDPEPRFRCPDPDDPDAEIFYDPRCPGTAPPEVAGEDDDDILIPEVDCPVCARVAPHTHAVAFVVHVFFALDSATLSQTEQRRLLREVGGAPRDGTLESVSVAGHADASGEDDYNLELSRRRTHHVRDLLERAGVEPSRIQTFAAGEHDPLVDQAPDPSVDAANRRVRVMLRYRIEPRATDLEDDAP